MPFQLRCILWGRSPTTVRQVTGQIGQNLSSYWELHIVTELLGTTLFVSQETQWSAWTKIKAITKMRLCRKQLLFLPQEIINMLKLLYQQYHMQNETWLSSQHRNTLWTVVTVTQRVCTVFWEPAELATDRSAGECTTMYSQKTLHMYKLSSFAYRIVRLAQTIVSCPEYQIPRGWQWQAKFKPILGWKWTCH